MVEIKMAENNEKAIEMAPTCMTSVNRIVKLPVVETSIQTASNVYEKVKDINGYAKWGFETMENTFHSVVEAGKPYAVDAVQKLDGPIKRVDNVLCSGLDYVEAKVPAVKLPPCELYNSTKGYVHDTVSPTVDAAYKTVHAVVDPAVNMARTVVDPAVQAAKPTVEAAYKMVEPMVQPAMDKANALKERVLHGEMKEEEEKEGRIPLILISWKIHLLTEFFELIIHIYYSLSLLRSPIIESIDEGHEDENDNH
ncbi:lipid storage droplets surface-binding protein 1-like isoform X2 [Coccinella septempunctata]|uniref:lipid storage droplets surface-binding protein 1-like isoform X2 n=1 Tax=Coccinella septempunctata TaxID=41139 RepID=UPI001D0632E8|nr:lipid storage droplets surface-binding protein 1-like isoform X2 [Coccinella septempunctata]